jgi:hypothetical protein
MDSGTDLLQHFMSVLEHAEADLDKASQKALERPGLSDADRQRLEAYERGAGDTIEAFRSTATGATTKCCTFWTN